MGSIIPPDSSRGLGPRICVPEDSGSADQAGGRHQMPTGVIALNQLDWLANPRCSI